MAKRFKWVGYSHDTAYEVSSCKEDYTEKDAYDSMRNSVLEKMKWNTEFDEDFSEKGDTIGYKVMFSQGTIVHYSYSGCYVYITYDASLPMPTWEQVFNEERVKWLQDYGIIGVAEVNTIESFRKARKREEIYLKEETDWYFDDGRRLYAQNRDTRMFENTSWTEGLVMVLFKDTDENDVANELGKRLREGKDYEFALYNSQHELVGYVYNPQG